MTAFSSNLMLISKTLGILKLAARSFTPPKGSLFLGRISTALDSNIDCGVRDFGQ